MAKKKKKSAESAGYAEGVPMIPSGAAPTSLGPATAAASGGQLAGVLLLIVLGTTIAC
jgi:hypothetical protein